MRALHIPFGVQKNITLPPEATRLRVPTGFNGYVLVRIIMSFSFPVFSFERLRFFVRHEKELEII